MNHKATLLLVVACGNSTAPIGQVRGTAPMATAVPEKPAIKHAQAAWFGRFDETGRFMRLTDVRRVDGRVFGWRIKLPCTGPIEFTETMQLPSPGDWRQITEARKANPDFLRATTISADGKQTVTHDYAACVDGWIEHDWTIAKQDPAGDWAIDVVIPHFAPISWRVRFRE